MRFPESVQERMERPQLRGLRLLWMQAVLRMQQKVLGMQVAMLAQQKSLEMLEALEPELEVLGML